MEEDPFPVKDFLSRYKRQETGGLLLNDKDLVAKQRKVLKHLIKSAAQRVGKGMSLMGMSLPVNIFEPISLLHRVCFMLGYAPTFLERAATESPVERIKLVTAFGVSLLHLCTEQKKPFNPVLGETLQGTIGSAEVYAEQTSHHPPVSSFLMLGTDFRVVGYHEFTANLATNSVTARQKGVIRIDFVDESVYLSLPCAHVKGLFMGARVFNWKGMMTVCDVKHKLLAQVAFRPHRKNPLLQLFTKRKEVIDEVEGGLVRVRNTHPVLTAEGLTKLLEECALPFAFEPREDWLADIRGYWPQYLDIGDRRYWSFEQFRPLALQPARELLPSDSRFRPDIVALAQGREREAQAAKETLEAQQRFDAKLRR